MRWRKCLEGHTELKLQYAFLKERLEALIFDERYEEAAELRLEIQKLEEALFVAFQWKELPGNY